MLEAHRPWLYLAAALAGAIVAFLVAAAPTLAPGRFPFAPDDGSKAAIDQALVLISLLFVPAAIFPSVIGAMFPAYSNATPVTLIRHTPLHTLLPFFAAALGAAVAAGVSAAFWPTTWFLAAPVLALVGLASVAAVWVIAYTLALLDPIRLADIVAERGLKTSDPEQAIDATGDLARLLRGMLGAHRLEVAIHLIGRLERVWQRHGAVLDPYLSERVLTEVEAAWGKDKRVRLAVTGCRAAIEAGKEVQRRLDPA
jgi:hypothetical protein